MSNLNNFSNQHRFGLEKGSKKYSCPACNKKTFVLYIDTETGNYLPDHYGRCDRESKCSYYLNPYLDGYANAIKEQEKCNQSILPNSLKPWPKKAIFQPPHEPVFFDFNAFKETLKPERYEQNRFIQNLLFNVPYPFDADEVTKVIEHYRLGTVINGYRAGAVTFPFIDKHCNLRAVQVKQFDEQNHTKSTDFLHSIIEKWHILNKIPLPEWLEAYLKQDKRVTCLFGEHLLNNYPNQEIGLVEAPKTAIYCHLYLKEYFPNILWMAVYNKSSFSFDKLKVLQGRVVYVFPDLSKEGETYKEWETKAKEFEFRLPGTRFIFSDLLEKLAPEPDKSKGNDLADYLINQDWRLFRKEDFQRQSLNQEPEKVIGVNKVTLQQNIFFPFVEPKDKVEIYSSEGTEAKKNDRFQTLSNQVTELEKFLSDAVFPNHPIQLDKCTTIQNHTLFVENHLSTIKANWGNSNYLVYLDRLINFKKCIENFT